MTFETTPHHTQVAALDSSDRPFIDFWYTDPLSAEDILPVVLAFPEFTTFYKMHKPSIASLVHTQLFPRARPNEPHSFAVHITRNLVPEVRVETANFYGALDCIEAQYPGLDYSSPPHRRRLSRFPWHRKLFKAFDELGLTRSEILALCQWEGTKSAKDKYEQDAGRAIRDTTMDGVAPPDPWSRPVAHFSQVRDWRAEAAQTTGEGGLVEDGGLVSDDEDEDVEIQDVIEDSYGVELNRQLRAAVDARARGETVVLDEQWEQWLKEAMERNDFGADVVLNAIREGRPIQSTPSHESLSIENPSTGNAARSGLTEIVSSQYNSNPNAIASFYNLRSSTLANSAQPLATSTARNIERGEAR